MIKKIVLALSTGIIIALSLPPFKTGFLAFGALIPFFLLLEDNSLGQAFRWGYAVGLSIDIFCLYWIGWVTVPGMLGAFLILPLYTALYAVIHVLLIRTFHANAYLLLPFVWTTIEYLQSLGETAFPWVYLGYTQSYYQSLIQYVDITSVYGVSFWIVLINVLIYAGYKRFQHPLTIAAITLFVFLIPLVHGIVKLNHRTPPSETITVGLIQGNIDPFEKWNRQREEIHFAIYDSLTQEAFKQDPDLMIWPETATSSYLRYDYNFIKRIRSWVDSTDVPLIAGSVDFEHLESGYEYYNAALLFEPDEYEIQHYRKNMLVPFSERVPYKHYFPFNVLKNLLYDMKLGIGDYARGGNYSLLRSPVYGDSISVAVPICYESVFPDYVSNQVQQGANLIAIITNDAWFGRTSAPYQHAQIAVFRAIENRKSIARAANTGISCFIDPYGFVSDSTPIFTTTQIVQEIGLYQGQTFYSRYGNVFALICLVFTLGFVLFASYITFFGKRITGT